MKKNLLIVCLIGAMSLNVGCFGNKTTETTTETTEITSEDTMVKNEENKTQETISEELLQFTEIKDNEEVAIIKTNYGEIKVRFFPEQAAKAVENFLTHSKDGYYNNLIFHRVIENFMIQGGDPTGTGTGGESIWGKEFENEPSLNLRHFYGALSMANAGADTNGSQFFIVQNNKLDDTYAQELEGFIQNQDEIIDGIAVKDVYPTHISEKYLEIGGTPWLDSAHTVFGQVYEGMDIVEKIAMTEKDANDKPIKDVIIENIEILEYSKTK